MLFTRCPDCETTFRITADALRKADGQVRCGRCARVFNAYHELRRRARRKSVAKDAHTAVTRDGHSPVATDGHGAAAKDGHRASATDGHAAAAREGHTAAASDERTAVARDEQAVVPRDDPTAAAAREPTAGTRHHDAAAAGAPHGDVPAAAGGIAPAAKPAASARSVDDESNDVVKDVVVGDISLASVIAELSASAEPDTAEPAPVDAPGTEIETITLLEKNGLALAVEGLPAAASGASKPRARGASEPRPSGGTSPQTPAWVIVDERRPKRLGGRVWSIGCVAAALFLALQVLHHFRGELALLAVVGPVVQEAYAVIGSEIVPDWDLDQYEIAIDWDAVRQSSAEEGGNLRIAANIRNKGPRPLPLPRVQVRLKDRWESTLGSRIFAPSEYMPPGSVITRMMAAGQTAKAELDIVDPGPQAYGFELDVCVDAPDGALRCAADEVFR